jgi:WhiB family redox-sensing transcriptional regulator
LAWRAAPHIVKAGCAGQAKAICARCLVQPDCLAFALRARQMHGVWGGATAEERYLLLHQDDRPPNKGSVSAAS